MGFGSVLSPIVNVRLVKNVFSFSASFVLPCKESTQLEENISIIMMSILLRTLKYI